MNLTKILIINEYYMAGFKGSCMDILKGDPQTKGKNGVYQIRVNSEVKSVYCDMSVKGGGWTVSVINYYNSLYILGHCKTFFLNYRRFSFNS